jgi:hypothetical protein
LSRPLIFLLLFIGLAFVGMLFWGSQRVGISTDEHIHMLDLGDWRWTSNPEKERHFGVYGLSFQLLGHGLAVILGIESINEVAYTPASFAARHFVVAGLGLVCSMAVGGIVWTIARVRLWAVWSAVALLAIPPFLGHSFFNTKDVPTATGYTLFTLSIILSLRALYQRNCSVGAAVGIVLLASGGVWLAVGTRLGMLFPFLLTFSFAVLVFLGLSRLIRLDILSTWRVVRWYVLGSLVGGVALILTNPCLIAPSTKQCATGIELLPKIFGVSSDYVWTGTTFIAGVQVFSQDPSFWLLPVAVAAGTPVLIGGLSLIAMVFVWENYVPSWVRSRAQNDRRAGMVFMAAMIGFVGLQLLLVPVAAIVLRSTIYDLQRQFLFVYPAIAAFSGLGLSLLWQLATNRRRGAPVFSWTVLCVALIALSVPLYESARLWPYTYVYVNPIASLPGYARYWETDYWQVGLKEALSRVPADSRFSVAGSYWLLTPQVLEEVEQGKQRKSSTDGVFVLQSRREGMGWSGHFPGCVPYDTVTRSIRGQVVPIAFVSLCNQDIEKKSWVETGIHPFEHVLSGP